MFFLFYYPSLVVLGAQLIFQYIKVHVQSFVLYLLFICFDIDCTVQNILQGTFFSRRETCVFPRGCRRDQRGDAESESASSRFTCRPVWVRPRLFQKVIIFERQCWKCTCSEISSDWTSHKDLHRLSIAQAQVHERIRKSYIGEVACRHGRCRPSQSDGQQPDLSVKPHLFGTIDIPWPKSLSSFFSSKIL